MAPRAGTRGGNELVRALRAMANAPTEAQRATIRKKALRPVVDNARLILQINRSVIVGGLSESLGVSDDPTKRNRSLAGPRFGEYRGRNAVAIAHLVEFPVRPHWQPRRFGGIMHPGHPGYPFMRPAIDYARPQVSQNYFTDVVRIIQDVGVRVGGGDRGRKRR